MPPRLWNRLSKELVHVSIRPLPSATDAVAVPLHGRMRVFKSGPARIANPHPYLICVPSLARRNSRRGPTPRRLYRFQSGPTLQGHRRGVGTVGADGQRLGGVDVDFVDVEGDARYLVRRGLDGIFGNRVFAGFDQVVPSRLCESGSVPAFLISSVVGWPIGRS